MAAVKIGTHDGTFHCDEVLAVFMLKILPQYKNAQIIRTRDPAKLKECDIVVDVGGTYDPSTHRYDHHQRTFTGTMNKLSEANKYPWATKLSSAGLVYLHFGKEIIANALGGAPDDTKTEELYQKVYENFIEEVDAIDNGIHTHDGVPRYKVTTTLSNRVKNLNPNWNNQNPDPEGQFLKALKMVGEEFIDRVNYFNSSWWPSRILVAEAIEKRFEIDPAGAILNLQQGGCPWQDHLFNLEEEQNLGKTIKYAIYQDQSGSWRVQAVPIFSGSFELRHPLKSEWRGIRDEELSTLSGIPGCVFVHAAGFIGGNKTMEGAIEMARQSLIKN